jgi:DNA-binding transcriptional ArsR family regulator
MASKDGRREDAESHRTRRAILNALERSKGDKHTPLEIRDRVDPDLPLTTVSYHLRVLHRAELVVAHDGELGPTYTLA